MAVCYTEISGNLPSKFCSSPVKNHTQNRLNRRSLPVFISTKPSDVNPLHLRDLFSLCNHSSHLFPRLDPSGRVDSIDANKLRTALSHSFVVVSVFSKPEFVSNSSSLSDEFSDSMGIGGDWIRGVMPVNPSNGQLVGFGRSVSDCALTASIYDIMVIPMLQGRGIGRMIVQEIIRMLTNRGINDISVVCADRERPFFKACGFGDDLLGSTTMMYTRTVSGNAKGDRIVKCAGRKLLLAPPVKEPFQ